MQYNREYHSPTKTTLSIVNGLIISFSFRASARNLAGQRRGTASTIFCRSPGRCTAIRTCSRCGRRSSRCHSRRCNSHSRHCTVNSRSRSHRSRTHLGSWSSSALSQPTPRRSPKGSKCSPSLTVGTVNWTGRKLNFEDLTTAAVVAES